MRTLLILFVCVVMNTISVFSVSGQTGADSIEGNVAFDDDSTTLNDSVYDSVDVAANFHGGDKAFLDYVVQQLQYPPRCQEEGINCEVLISFVVDRKGRIRSVVILEGTPRCPEFSDEAIRIMKKSPNWIPAIKDGKLVASRRKIPISVMIE